MSGFQSPNHTQVPNELIDIYMKNMDKSELKVILCIIRQTLGWHRTRTRFSIGNICRITGLARSNVLVGAENAERRGLIRRIPDTIPTEWELVWSDAIEPPPVIGGTDTDPLLLQEDTPPTIGGQPLLLQEGLKERNKIKERDHTQPEFADIPVDPFITMLSRVTGLLPNGNDLGMITRWQHEGVTEDDIRDALQWRKDNHKPPIKVISNLAGGVETSRLKRIQGDSSKPNGEPIEKPITQLTPAERIARDAAEVLRNIRPGR